MPESIDVAQLVLRASFSTGDYYLLANRTLDSTWEFIGGKRKAGETLREAARRELDEELEAIDPSYIHITAIGDSYPSPVGSEYLLHPVLMDVPASVAESVDNSDLSDEHETMAWITLDQFDQYETRGQTQALEELDLLPA